MSFSRRSFLSLSVSAGLAAAFSSVFLSAAAAEPDTAAYRRLSERWVDIITGRNLIDPKDSRYAKALAALDDEVAAILQDVVRTPERNQIFASLDLNSPKSVNITQTAVKAQTLALAWATPGSRYYQDKAVLQDSIEALRDFLALRYHPGQEAYDNWWSWEIGASRAVSDMMCILRDELPQEVMDNAAQAIVYFVPDPWYLRTKKAAGSAAGGADSRTVATGANRLDLSLSAICAALAVEDGERIRHALAGIPDTLRLVESGDGFYRDGSFIQHVHVPYTGSYGDVFLTGLSMLFTLVSDSAFNVPAAQQAAAYRAVEESFIPVMIDAQVADAVRGRSVSRLDESKNMRGASITKAILLLAQGAPEAVANRWRGLCAGWIQRNGYDKLASEGSITHLALVADALAKATPLPGLSQPRMFAAMDRLFHRTPDWTMVVAMCSKRISWYECGNGENELASRTGSGMRYLYLPADMGQFEDGFWPTLDYTAPPGTTVDNQPLLPKAAGEWAEKTPNNEWSGGLAQGERSLAGMHLIGPDSNGLQARRLWYGTKNGMLEAVTDVKTGADEALTVVECRNLGENGNRKLLVDGQPVTDKTIFQQPKWAHLEGVGGYIFLTPGEVRAQLEPRSGRWRDINHFQKTPGVEDLLTRYWASLHFVHPQEDTGGAWMVVPLASPEETAALAATIHEEGQGIHLLQNDAAAQVVNDTAAGVTAWSVWRPGHYADWQFEQPALALARSNAGQIYLSVSEPTQTAEQVKIHIPGHWKISGDSQEVSAEIEGDNTLLTVDSQGKAGSSVDCILVKV